MSRRYKFPRRGINTVFTINQKPRDENIIYWVWNHKYHHIKEDDLWAVAGLFFFFFLITHLI
jgi:hypothetical protein